MYSICTHVFEKLVAASLYRMRISCVRACTCTCNLYTHELTRMRNATYWCKGDYTHTNNVGYSNGSSLPVEGLEINDV